MSHKVFLGNLPDDVRREDIQDWLQSEGFAFEHIQLLCDTTGFSRNAALIRVGTFDELEPLIQRYDTAPIGDKVLHASIAKNTPRRREGE